MKVSEIVNTISDSIIVKIIEDSEIVATYDGKNSIDESYNDREVTFIDILTLNLLHLYV